MVTPRIVSLSEDFTTWLSIWSDNSSAGAFLEDFEPMAIVCYLLGLAFRRFTLYHRVTFSVSLFSSSAAFLLEIFAAFPSGRRFWRPLACSPSLSYPWTERETALSILEVLTKAWNWAQFCRPLWLVHGCARLREMFVLNNTCTCWVSWKDVFEFAALSRKFQAAANFRRKVE